MVQTSISSLSCCSFQLSEFAFTDASVAPFSISRHLFLALTAILYGSFSGAQVPCDLICISWVKQIATRSNLIFRLSNSFMNLSSSGGTNYSIGCFISPRSLHCRWLLLTANHVFFAACRAAKCCSRSHCSYDTAIQYSSCWPWCAISKCSSWCCKSLIQPSFAVSLFSAAPILRVRLCYAFRTFSQLINFASAFAAPFKSLYQWYVPNISAFMWEYHDAIAHRSVSQYISLIHADL